MRSKTFLPLVLLIFLFTLPLANAQIIDSVNYGIDIGDAEGFPGMPVAIPIMVKNQIALGSFLIRIEYDTDIMVPIPMDACPDDACPGYCCDSSDIDPNATVFDSLGLSPRGLTSLIIDSSAEFCIDPSFPTVVRKNIYAIHDPGDDSMHANAFFVQFLPPIPPFDECAQEYWTAPYIGPETGDASPIAYVMFKVKPDVAPDTYSSLYVRDYRPAYGDDPAPDFRDNQFTDTTGAIVIRPIGAFGHGILHIGEFDGICGDVNYDGELNLLDIVYILAYKFKFGPPPVADFIADVNNDDVIDIQDIVYLINYKFKSGPAPVCQ